MIHAVCAESGIRFRGTSKECAGVIRMFLRPAKPEYRRKTRKRRGIRVRGKNKGGKISQIDAALSDGRSKDIQGSGAESNGKQKALCYLRKEAIPVAFP